MHIKQIIIHGFKSYRERIVVEPFDPRINVIVGRNGSGKSNFFSAIEFVLSSEYSHLIPVQRRLIMHEGSGPPSTAYIEIVFDNEDGRFPTNNTEVHLRRMIGSEKDNYFLDKTIISKSEVDNMLEAAGFSKSNPYYIVKQGEINQLATASDSQRLKLLLDIAGARVYDEKTEKSRAIMNEARNHLDKASESLQNIEERFQALEAEKEELREYQRYDKKRRFLEHTIYRRELDSNKRKFVEFEESRTKIVVEQRSLMNMTKKMEETSRVATERWKITKDKVQTAVEDQDMLNTELEQVVRKITATTLTIDDLKDEIKTNEETKKKAQTELEILQRKINEKMKKLEDIKPDYDKLLREEEELNRELTLKEQQRRDLYLKQDRINQFDSKDTRDEWIKKQLHQLNEQIRDEQKHCAEIQKNLESDRERRKKLDNDMETLQRDMEAEEKSMDRYKKLRCEEMEKAEQARSKLKELYRNESIVQEKLSIANNDLSKAENRSKLTIGKAILNGRESVRKVLEFRDNAETSEDTDPVECVQVIDVLSCQPEFRTAVEVVAGKRLYHYIVKNDRTVTKILKQINRLRLPGEVNFLPLNRIKVKTIDYPSSTDVAPMIDKLNYDRKYDSAMRFIFGRTVICRSLDIATKFARSNGLDCVTLQGDVVHSKGDLTGGYRQYDRTQLDDHQIRRNVEETIRDLNETLSTIKSEIKTITETINRHDSNIQKAEILIEKSKDNREKMETDVRSIRNEVRNEVSTIENRRVPNEKRLACCTTNLDAMRATKMAFERELNQDLKSQLSPTEHHLLDTLNERINTLTRRCKIVFDEKLKFEEKLFKLENTLTNNLSRRKDQLTKIVRDSCGSDQQRQLETLGVQLGKLVNDRMEIVHKCKEQAKRVERALQTQKVELENLQKSKSMLKETQEQLEELDREVEKLLSKRNVYEKKNCRINEKIAELGTLPNAEDYERFVAMSSKHLFEELERTYSAIKRYSDVNQKAIDQYDSLSRLKTETLKRIDELQRDREKIQESMHVLEQKKIEIIRFTFDQVSKYFSEMFEKLASPGRASLIMRTVNGEDSNENDDSGVMDTDNYSGIGISVSFTGRANETTEITQLSGGQKSIVALALIFAIQKCDPAPFYLFDEIDHALDAQHRQAVANIIHELSSNAQFMITTFKPEIVRQANKCYGVQFANGVSHIESVTQERAEEFVEANGRDER